MSIEDVVVSKLRSDNDYLSPMILQKVNIVMVI